MESKKYTKTDILEVEMKNLAKTNSDDHKNILDQISCINGKLDELFVTKDEFNPIRNVVYGMVGLVLTAVAGALIRLIIVN